MIMESKLIDHILLNPDVATKQIEDLCAEAKKCDSCSACIDPCQVETVTRYLKGSDVKVCTVVGFPSEAYVTGIKSAETKQAVADGAQKVDMAINMGAVKGGNWGCVKNGIAVVVETAEKEMLVKVILKTYLLVDEEVMEVCKYTQAAGVDFVKTSTRSSKAGATAKAVALMRKTVGDTIGIRATGGIRAPGASKAMVAAGANRVGASTGTKLIGGAQ